MCPLSQTQNDIHSCHLKRNSWHVSKGILIHTFYTASDQSERQQKYKNVSLVDLKSKSIVCSSPPNKMSLNKHSKEQFNCYVNDQGQQVKGRTL